MDKKLISQVKQARVDLESALVNSGVAIAQQDLNLRYTQFVNTIPASPRRILLAKPTAIGYLPMKPLF